MCEAGFDELSEMYITSNLTNSMKSGICYTKNHKSVIDLFFLRMGLNIGLALTGLSFWRGNWALGYHSMGFRQFPDISEFPKILSFDNS